MDCNIARLARLLNDLVIAKTFDDLLWRGYEHETLRRNLKWLEEYGFARKVEYKGKTYYHLTGRGAELLSLLRESLVDWVTRYLKKKGINYKVWWGDEGIRIVAPIIYVDRFTEIPIDITGLIEIRVAEEIARQNKLQGRPSRTA